MKKWFRRRANTRTYGGDGTIHQTGWIDVETYHGKVVAVWFRCLLVPFKQAETTKDRATDLELIYDDPSDMADIVSIDLDDRG